jgi:hypothetical protein
MKAELHNSRGFSGLAVLVLIASLFSGFFGFSCFSSSLAHADASAPSVTSTQDPDSIESVALTGVLRSIAGPGGETTGVALFPMDDLNNTHNTAVEVDFNNLKDPEAARAFVTGYGEADKVVEVSGVYQYLNLGPMRPHFQVLMAQNVRAAD